MIEKMKFMRITGPKEDINRVIDVYLKKYQLHVENALSDLNGLHNLTPYVDTNSYKETVSKSEEIIKQLKIDTASSGKQMTYKEAEDFLTNMHLLLGELKEQKQELLEQKQAIIVKEKQMEPFKSLEFDLKKLSGFKFVKYQFGRIAIDYYEKFVKYIYEALNIIFYECKSDKNYVWGVYFVPQMHANKVDAILSSLHFEDVDFDEQYEGTPSDVCAMLANQRKEVTKNQAKLNDVMKEVLKKHAGDFIAAYDRLSSYCNNSQVRKLAACTRKEEEVYYILCGWMSEKDTKSFLTVIEGDEEVNCLVDDNISSTTSTPPTKLKNPKIFKPFETFIKMYGLPAYKEIDPTIFVALTYSFMFGMMYGDVGQGLCLVLGGFVLYKIKKLNLAAIISCAGIFSTIFGFLYGSIFGYEDVLTPLWTNPMHDTMTVLFAAIGFGVALNMIAMIMNIINGIRQKNVEKYLLDTNGIAGLVFYAAVISIVVLIATGHTAPGFIVMFFTIILPLILIFLREPLSRWIEKKKDLIQGSKGMFFLEAFFELFEVLLSYVTNTISFVRVGAFALSHAGMMSVVLMLGKAETLHPNLLIIALGNIFVAGLEGLIVGIQVLRLEYYEMFSRFYSGTGKEFKSLKKK